MALTGADLVTLQTELNDDPLGRGYAGMTNTQAAADLNTQYRTQDRTTMSAGEIMEHIDNAEFVAKTDAQQARIDRVLGLGSEVIVGPGNSHNAITELLAVFGGGSITIGNLAAARAQAISRAVELGLGSIGEGDVWDARNN